MYRGEVAIPTEDVPQFLAVAEQFKVSLARAARASESGFVDI